MECFALTIAKSKNSNFFCQELNAPCYVLYYKEFFITTLGNLLGVRAPSDFGGGGVCVCVCVWGGGGVRGAETLSPEKT